VQFNAPIGASFLIPARNSDVLRSLRLTQDG
jgi:hypothetical protein